MSVISAIERIPKPVRTSEYVRIYKPTPDIYRGENTESFTTGEYYDDWITNDFSILRDGDDWHIVGITHPRPKDFIDNFNFTENVHEAEFQLFHCTASASDFASLMHESSFTDREKILYPSARPGESKEIWAPHLQKRDGKFEIIYSPGSMRSVQTTDFVNFDKPRVLFESKFAAARDPYVFTENGEYFFLWLDSSGLKVRTSRNFEVFDDERTIYTPPFKRASCESPFLMKRGEYYYLFWCIYDGTNGCYDNRTYVFAAKSIFELEGRAPIAMLDAHAPEIVCDGGKYYLLSVYYPENGISAAELEFI